MFDCEEYQCRICKIYLGQGKIKKTIAHITIVDLSIMFLGIFLILLCFYDLLPKLVR